MSRDDRMPPDPFDARMLAVGEQLLAALAALDPADVIDAIAALSPADLHAVALRATVDRLVRSVQALGAEARRRSL